MLQEKQVVVERIKTPIGKVQGADLTGGNSMKKILVSKPQLVRCKKRKGTSPGE